MGMGGGGVKVQFTKWKKMPHLVDHGFLNGDEDRKEKELSHCFIK